MAQPISPRISPEVLDRLARQNAGKPGRPKISPEVLIRLMELSLQEPHITGKEIEYILTKDFEGQPFQVPAKRTCQHYANIFQKWAANNKHEQPLSLATIDEIGIPWEGINWLLKAHIECEKRMQQGEELWPWTSRFFTEVQEELMKNQPFTHRCIMTNRQARWLWRIHLVLPEWSIPNWLPELCERADEYAHREMISDYLGYSFDTIDLDASLRNILRSIKDRERSISQKEQERGTK